ncbi:hypothetical protein ACGC1H_005584 [Rhizoctonia solani]
MRLISTLVALSISVSLVSASPTFGLLKGICGYKRFWWKEKAACLPYGGVYRPPPPPVGHNCLNKWYWSDESNCCVPEKPTTPKLPCAQDWFWSPETYSCVPNGGGGRCNKGDFWWVKKECCLPHGGIPAPSSPPNGYQCPNQWYWGSDRGCCVPSVPDVPTTPACPVNYSWSSDSYCVPNPTPAPPPPPKTGPDSCSEVEFWWGSIALCLPIGGPHSPPSPPEGTYCPSDWYWGSHHNCCLPKSRPYDNKPPSCPITYSWVVELSWCKPLPSGPPSCSNSEFWWADRKCCLPHGGPKTPANPPYGKTCPNGWSWGVVQGCCVPHLPPVQLPTCGFGRKWSLSSLCCLASGLIGGILDAIF